MPAPDPSVPSFKYSPARAPPPPPLVRKTDSPNDLVKLKERKQPMYIVRKIPGGTHGSARPDVTSAGPLASPINIQNAQATSGRRLVPIEPAPSKEFFPLPFEQQGPSGDERRIRRMLSPSRKEPERVQSESRNGPGQTQLASRIERGKPPNAPLKSRKHVTLRWVREPSSRSSSQTPQAVAQASPVHKMVFSSSASAESGNPGLSGQMDVDPPIDMVSSPERIRHSCS